MEIIKNIAIVISKDFVDFVDKIEDICQIEDENERVKKGIEFVSSCITNDDIPVLVKKILGTTFIPALYEEDPKNRMSTVVEKGVDSMKEYVKSDKSGLYFERIYDQLKDKIFVKEEGLIEIVINEE